MSSFTAACAQAYEEPFQWSVVLWVQATLQSGMPDKEPPLQTELKPGYRPA